MNSQLNNEVAWNELKYAYANFVKAQMNFFQKSPDIVATLRRALDDPEERILALETAALLPIEQRQSLFFDLLTCVSYCHGATALSRDLILSLPRKWILQHIEDAVEPILQAGGYEEYQALLDLYFLLDRDLTRRLATRALNQSDPELNEIASDFLTELDNKRKS